MLSLILCHNITADWVIHKNIWQQLGGTRDYNKKHCEILPCENSCKWTRIPLSARRENRLFFFFLLVTVLSDASLLHNYVHIYTFHWFRLVINHHPIYYIHQQVSSVYFKMDKMFGMHTVFFTFFFLQIFFTACTMPYF